MNPIPPRARHRPNILRKTQSTPKKITDSTSAESRVSQAMKKAILIPCKKIKFKPIKARGLLRV